MPCFSSPFSPNESDDFAADASVEAFLLGQQSRASRDDCDAKATERQRQSIGLCVTTQARLGDTLDALNGTLAVRAILEGDLESLADLGFLGGEVLDVAFTLQDLGDVRLELGVRHIHGLVLCRARITQTRKHVCDRICHWHLG